MPCTLTGCNLWSRAGLNASREKSLEVISLYDQTHNFFKNVKHNFFGIVVHDYSPWPPCPWWPRPRSATMAPAPVGPGSETASLRASGLRLAESSWPLQMKSSPQNHTISKIYMWFPTYPGPSHGPRHWKNPSLPCYPFRGINLKLVVCEVCKIWTSAYFAYFSAYFCIFLLQIFLHTQSIFFYAIQVRSLISIARCAIKILNQ